MTRQPDLFRPMCASVRARQGELFDTGGPPATWLRCRHCGRFLARTPSGFLACPMGHGKLLREATDPQSADEWEWLDDSV
jgi:hypothetical protein